MLSLASQAGVVAMRPSHCLSVSVGMCPSLDAAGRGCPAGVGLARVCAGVATPGLSSGVCLRASVLARAPTVVLGSRLGPEAGGSLPRMCMVSSGPLLVGECASFPGTLCVQKAGIYRGRERGSGCQGLGGAGRR